MKSDDELRLQWLAENYAYIMVNGPEGMEHAADPTGKGDLRAAIDAAIEKQAGMGKYSSKGGENG